MAAVIAPISTRSGSLRPAAPAPTPARPPLQLIPGGRQAARDHARHLRRAQPVHPSVYLRRRLGFGLAALCLVAIAYLAITGLGVVVRGETGRAGPGTSTSAVADPGAAAPAGVTSPAGTTYVVQPGDTLWSIARSLHPSRDIRAVVDDLASRAGPGPLQSGQRLSVDGLAD